MQDWIVLGLRLLAPVLLTVFWGLIFYQMLVVEKRNRQVTAILRCLNDSEPIEAVSTELSFGRAKDNTIVIADEFISAHHATLTLKSDVWWLVDLGSTNGTRVNEKRVTEPVPLDYGDIINLGIVEYRLERAD